MIRYALALTWAVSTVALAATGNISKVNGGIEVETGQEAGDVERERVAVGVDGPLMRARPGHRWAAVGASATSSASS